MPRSMCTFEMAQFPERRLALTTVPILQGTVASKKKKEKKLQRVMAAVKKQKRKATKTHENFAAIQLLHDPQVPPPWIISSLSPIAK